MLSPYPKVSRNVSLDLNSPRQILLSSLFLGLLALAPLHAKPITPERGGMLDVTQFGAIPNDSEDDTSAVQDTINAALENDLAVYFPAGTYLISDTLEAKAIGRRYCGGEATIPCRLIGYNSGEANGPRAILRLQDNLKNVQQP